MFSRKWMLRFLLETKETLIMKFGEYRGITVLIFAEQPSTKISARLIDEYPILFVACSFASGTSSFFGLGELKVKESNRLKTMAKALSENGVKLKKKYSIKIFGDKNPFGKVSCNG